MFVFPRAICVGLHTDMHSAKLYVQSDFVLNTNKKCSKNEFGNKCKNSRLTCKLDVPSSTHCHIKTVVLCHGKAQNGRRKKYDFRHLGTFEVLVHLRLDKLSATQLFSLTSTLGSRGHTIDVD